MSKEVIFTIRKVGQDKEHIVYGHSWDTLEIVWLSQLCWYMPGSHVIVTNTETGESQEFYKKYKNKQGAA